MARKYIDYLRDQLYYWKKKLDKISGMPYTERWIEQMYETFREKIEKEKEKK
jgi:hypothetical protein|tara:strand:- start:429 stop:584 length:156 start_codon:yes stop_codon:yes gene_type:complete